MRDEQVVNVPQGSPEWHALRKDTMTGTRSAKVLIGKEEEVMREMVRQHFDAEDEVVVTPPMENGSRMEPVARRCYAEDYSLNVEEVGFVLHYTIPWLAFSPDGLIRTWGELSKLLEIKVPYSQAVYSTIPPQYEEQCRIGMEVCDVESCDLYIWTPDERMVVTYHRDPAWWEWARGELETFYQRYMQVIEKPELYEKYLEPKVLVRDDDDWLHAADNFIQAKAAHEVTKKMLDDARDAVINIAAGRDTEGCGVRATTFLSKDKPTWRVTTL